METDVPIEVFKAMDAEVTQPDVFRLALFVFEQFTRGLREQDLAAVCSRRHASRAMNRDTVVATVLSGRCPAVQPHPNDGRGPVDPLVRDERSLRVDGGEKRVGRRGEREEACVTLSVDELATTGGRGITKKPLMLRQHLGIAFAQRLEQLRGSLHVGEQEGSRAGAALGHFSILTSRVLDSKRTHART